MKISTFLGAGKKSLQLLLIIALSAIAATSVFLYLQGVGGQIRSQGETLDTYISSSLVPAGLTLQEALAQGLIVKEKMIQSSRPADTLNQVDQTNSGLVALRDLQPGQIILNSSFGFAVEDAGGLPIPDGKLAVSITLSDVAKVATFLRPGSDVAVFASVPAKESGKQPSVRLLFSKLKILAIGAQISNADGQVPTSTLITVAVTPIEAEKLIYSSTYTSLYLGLLTSSANLDNLAPITSSNLFN